MRYTVSNYYGDSMFPNLQVAAKTGTAEVGDNKIPTGWIVGYSERDDFAFGFSPLLWKKVTTEEILQVSLPIQCCKKLQRFIHKNIKK